MLPRIFAVGLLSVIVLGSASFVRQSHSGGQEPCAQTHEAWVTDALEKMQTIKPGMTRGQLLKVFTVEGGISARTQRTYVSRDCPYFKETVEFRAVGQPSQDKDGRLSPDESDRDVIVKISQPYLQFTISD